MATVDCCEDLHVDDQRVIQARRAMASEQAAADLAETFKALADPTRVRIISALAGMELCVGELAAALDMTVSAVSHQLRLLRRLRVVRHRREGRHIFYTLDDEHVSMMYSCGVDHLRHS